MPQALSHAGRDDINPAPTKSTLEEPALGTRSSLV
jgi:hypothetical protein